FLLSPTGLLIAVVAGIAVLSGALLELTGVLAVAAVRLSGQRVTVREGAAAVVGGVVRGLRLGGGQPRAPGLGPPPVARPGRPRRRRPWPGCSASPSGGPPPPPPPPRPPRRPSTPPPRWPGCSPSAPASSGRGCTSAGRWRCRSCCSRAAGRRRPCAKAPPASAGPAGRSP